MRLYHEMNLIDFDAANFVNYLTLDGSMSVELT